METPRCYGTTEYSLNSGICRNCQYHKLCGEVSPRKNKVKEKPINHTKIR